VLKIGLTGGIGSGKSTVSSMIKDLSIPVVDADIISREVISLYPKILDEIKLEFGEQFIDENGNLKRRELGNYIFDSEEKRKKLESIIIPYITQEIFRQIHVYEEKGEELCILDAPTLIENNLHKVMDKNILIWVDRETQIRRVILRDTMTKAEVEARLDSQIVLTTKKEMVDYVIDNTHSLLHTKDQLMSVLNDIRYRGKK